MMVNESARMRKEFAWIPKLMTAVLVQACCDLQASAIGIYRQGGVLMPKEAQAEVYAEARAWFLNQDPTVFGFATVCRALGIRRERILRRMAGYLCPALEASRVTYVAGDWRTPLRDGKYTRAAA